MPQAWANRLPANIMLGICALLFIVLGIQQLVSALGPLLEG